VERGTMEQVHSIVMAIEELIEAKIDYANADPEWRNSRFVDARREDLIDIVRFYIVEGGD
jgi:hypothetical protein